VPNPSVFWQQFSEFFLKGIEFLFKISGCQVVENAEFNKNESALRIAFQKSRGFFNKYHGASVLGKTENAGTDCGQR
jgi:hypothetical protein